MSKYYRIPYFKVGEESPSLLLMLDEYYEQSEWFRRFEPTPEPQSMRVVKHTHDIVEDCE